MEQLGMFAKFWRPGAVKTRLAGGLGSARSSRLYRAFLATLLYRMQDLARRRALWYSPRQHSRDFAAVIAGSCRLETTSPWCGRFPPRGRLLPIRPGKWKIHEQGSGDLGQRMKRYFSSSLASGTRRVVLIGSDSPTLPTSFVQEAFAMLEQYPVVLGPSEDGGYYLVGVRDKVPPIFDDMPWSSTQLWQATTERLAASQISYGRLPVWYDVDEADDLWRLQAELTSRPLSRGLLTLRQVCDQMCAVLANQTGR